MATPAVTRVAWGVRGGKMWTSGTFTMTAGSDNQVQTGLRQVTRCTIVGVTADRLGIYTLNSKTVGGDADDPGWVTFDIGDYTAANTYQFYAEN